MIIKLQQEFELTRCPGCGFEFALPVAFLERKKRNGSKFYCPSACGDTSGLNTSSIFFPKPEPPKERIVEVERIVEKEVVVEKPHEPRNFQEMLEAHTHDFKKTRNHECRICGLHEAAFQMLTH